MASSPKKYAFETVKDSATRYNLDLLSKQIDALRSDYDRVNLVTSDATQYPNITRSTSIYPSFTDIPQLNKTIVTTGKPVQLSLQPGRSGNNFQGSIAIVSFASANCVAYLRFIRDGATIWETLFGMSDVTGGTFNRTSFHPPSQFSTIDDDVTAGNHQYKVSGAVLGSGQSLNFNFIRLTALELSGNAPS